MSLFFGNRLMRGDPFCLQPRAYMCPPPDDDGKGGGGGGGDKGDKGDKTDHTKTITDLQASNTALLARLDALEKKGAGDKGDKGGEDDLETKARKEREAADKKNADTKTLEAALRFSLGAKDWLKTNATLLPKDIEGIFTAAEKENYGSALEKDAAIKTGIIQTFFNLQANLDLLTPSQKSALEDWQKLTKNGKQEKAQTIYDSIFEPSFEMLKRIKKAEQLNQGGHVNTTDSDKAYKEKLMKRSRQHYMGEKADA